MEPAVWAQIVKAHISLQRRCSEHVWREREALQLCTAAGERPSYSKSAVAKGRQGCHTAAHIGVLQAQQYGSMGTKE